MVVLQAVPLLGLYAGDELLRPLPHVVVLIVWYGAVWDVWTKNLPARINGEDISDLCACKAGVNCDICGWDGLCEELCRL